MAALRYDLIVDQGADHEVTIPVLDPDGQPVDLAGWTARGQVRAGHAAATVLHTLDLYLTDDGVVVRVPAATSAAWTWRLARYDLELVAPNSEVTRLVEGAVVVSPEITRI